MPAVAFWTPEAPPLCSPLTFHCSAGKTKQRLVIRNDTSQYESIQSMLTIGAFHLGLFPLSVWLTSH